MKSNGKQFTVTREILTAVARDQRWPDVVAGISTISFPGSQMRDPWNEVGISSDLRAFFKICFCFALLYKKSLNDWSLGEQ